MNIKGKIVIGMPLKNGASTIRRAVASIFSQKNVNREILLVIANDNSTDNWKEEILDYLNTDKVIIKNVDFGKSYKVRNFLNNFIRNEIENVDYIGRLDADDYIVNNTVLSEIEKIMNKYNPDVIISGNKLAIDNKIIDRINFADRRLLDLQFLESKLELMAEGNPLGELPSCNTFIKPSVNIEYKDVESAEDHWFTVDLLLNKDKYNIYIAENILYAVYSLSGDLTNLNKKKYKYLKSRNLLLKYFMDYEKQT